MEGFKEEAEVLKVVLQAASGGDVMLKCLGGIEGSQSCGKGDIIFLLNTFGACSPHLPVTRLDAVSFSSSLLCLLPHTALPQMTLPKSSLNLPSCGLYFVLCIVGHFISVTICCSCLVAKLCPTLLRPHKL